MLGQRTDGIGSLFLMTFSISAFIQFSYCVVLNCRSFLFSASSVASDVTGNCEVSLLHRHPIALPRPEALLHCGSEISPWILKVPSGQRINITLFEFYSFSSSSSTPSSLTSTSPTSSGASPPRSAVHPARPTALFAPVRETWPVGGGETVDVRALLSPSTVARETHVHTTLSNSVEVTLNGSGKDEFLLTFAGERQRYKLPIILTLNDPHDA